MMNSQGSADLLNALEQLQCAVALLQKNSNNSDQFDLLCSVHRTALEALCLSDELMRPFQTCPGPYWRRFDGVMNQLERMNETKKRKMSLKMECTAPHPLVFDKAGSGPPYPKTWDPEAETRRAVCNQCYQIFMRDKKGGAI